MELVVQTKPLPTPEQASALEATPHACNDAATWVAQVVQLVIKKVADAYTTLTENLKDGRYGKPGSRRRRRVEFRPVRFRPDGAQAYDSRMLSWQHHLRTVSIWTTIARMKSAKRLLAKRRRKESRHAADVNHQISKKIVTEATRTGRGIALENLTGIRERVRLRKPQRVTLSSRSLRQLGEHLRYKARLAGVPTVPVDPRYPSQTCCECGHRDRRNRPDQETFHCRSCGVVANADHNAARDIAARGARDWGAANPPTRGPTP